MLEALLYVNAGQVRHAAWQLHRLCGIHRDIFRLEPGLWRTSWHQSTSTLPHLPGIHMYNDCTTAGVLCLART